MRDLHGIKCGMLPLHCPIHDLKQRLLSLASSHVHFCPFFKLIYLNVAFLWNDTDLRMQKDFRMSSYFFFVISLSRQSGLEWINTEDFAVIYVCLISLKIWFPSETDTRRQNYSWTPVNWISTVPVCKGYIFFLWFMKIHKTCCADVLMTKLFIIFFTLIFVF